MAASRTELRQREEFIAAQFLRTLPLAFGCVLVAVYLLFTTSHLGGADSGELVGASYNWGIAHPPGYPLYITLSKIFSLVSPFSDVLYTYNLFSTLCAIAAFILLYVALRHAEIHPLAILAGGSFFVFSPISLRWLTTAEVFSLHLLISACGMAITIALLKRKKITPLTRLLGLCAGLGAANHHTILFLFPGFFAAYGSYWIRLENRDKIRELAWLGLLFLLGLSFYLQPIISSRVFDPPVSALGISVHSLQDLIDLFLRRLYGTFSLAAQVEGTLPPFFWVRRYLITAIFSWQGLTAITGLLIFYQAAAFCVGKKNLQETTFFLWFAAPLVFFALIKIPFTPVVELEIVSRMYLMPSLTAALFAVLGLNRLITPIHNRNTVVRSLLALATVMVLLLTSWNGTTRITEHDPGKSLAHGRAILNSCTENSVLFLVSDDTIFSTFYLQEVEGFRRDVATIAWPMTVKARYHQYLAKKWGHNLGLTSPLSVKPGGLGNEQETRSEEGVSTPEWLLLLLEKGVDVFTLAEISSMLSERDEKPDNRLTTTPSGVVFRIHKRDLENQKRP